MRFTSPVLTTHQGSDGESFIGANPMDRWFDTDDLDFPSSGVLVAHDEEPSLGEACWEVDLRGGHFLADCLTWPLYFAWLLQAQYALGQDLFWITIQKVAADRETTA